MGHSHRKVYLRARGATGFRPRGRSSHCRQQGLPPPPRPSRPPVRPRAQPTLMTALLLFWPQDPGQVHDLKILSSILWVVFFASLMVSFEAQRFFNFDLKAATERTGYLRRRDSRAMVSQRAEGVEGPCIYHLRAGRTRPPADNPTTGSASLRGRESHHSPRQTDRQSDRHGKGLPPARRM